MVYSQCDHLSKLRLEWNTNGIMLLSLFVEVLENVRCIGEHCCIYRTRKGFYMNELILRRTIVSLKTRIFKPTYLNFLECIVSCLVHRMATSNNRKVTVFWCWSFLQPNKRMTSLIVVFFQHSIYQMAICTVQSTNMNALCTKKIQHNILMNEYQNGNNLSTLFHLVAIEMLSILQDALWILSIILRFLWEIIEEVQITKLTNEEYKLTKRQHYWIEILQTEFSNRFTFTSKGPSFS